MKKQDPTAPSVSAGLPNAAETADELPLDFNELFFNSPHSTYIMRVATGQNINPNGENKNGDILVVDRAVEPTANSTVVMYLDSELQIGRLSDFKSAQQEYILWGTVTYRVSPLL